MIRGSSISRSLPLSFTATWRCLLGLCRSAVHRMNGHVNHRVAGRHCREYRQERSAARLDSGNVKAFSTALMMCTSNLKQAEKTLCSVERHTLQWARWLSDGNAKWTHYKKQDRARSPHFVFAKELKLKESLKKFQRAFYV